MRLHRLDLTRYGKFTDHSIDFGAPAPGRPDLHIVYGPNEAGKSTALSAYLDILFGIETRSPYNFQHSYDTMRIGAALEIAGTVHELARIKRARGTLLDGNGQPIGETLLSGQLGNIDREAYRAMFSLDDDTLEAGGESILASKGDLGELLFSASAGLAELSRKLTELRAEADGFYRYHAHNTELAACKSKLAELKEQRDKIDTAASRYAALVDARDVALRQYEEAIAARTTIQSRMTELQRHLGALPRLAALRALQAQLAPLSGLPAAPPGWREALPALQEQATTLAVQRETLARDLAATAAALEAIVVDEDVLAIAGRLDRLNDLQARHVTADKDVPVRRLEVREADLQIAGILGRLGRANETDPARLLLSAATVGALQDLMAKRSGIETALATAQAELEAARDALREAETALRVAAPDGAGTLAEPGRLAVLEAAVTAVQRSDAAARRRVAERHRADHAEALADRLQALRPWQGDAEQCAALAVPDAADLQNWQAELTAAQNQHTRREEEVERARAEQARLAAAREAIVQVAGVVSDQEAATIRMAREAAWAAHRRTLDTASADNFETALRHDDVVMQARLRHEADVTRLHQTGEALARAAADETRAQEECDKAAIRLQHIRQQIESAASPFLPGATLDAFKAWLGRRDKALEARAALRQAERDLRDADADAEALQRGLHEALDAAGVAHDPAGTVEALRAAAQAVLDREGLVKARRDALQDRSRDVQSRERRLKAAADRDAAWQAAWATACAGCWLGESAPPSVGSVRELLAALTDLAPALQRRISLLDRIEKMQADQRDFAAEAEAVAGSLGWDAGAAAPLTLAQRIVQAINDARTAATLREARLQEQETLRRRQQNLAAAQRLHEARSGEMLAYFEAESLAQVAARLADIARKVELERQAHEAARDILDAMQVPSIEAAERLLETADRAALEAELASSQGKFADHDQRARDLFLQYGKAEDQVEQVGGDAAAARIDEQRRTLLLQIEDRAAHYLRLRAGIAAAEHALRAYRQQHRSEMMARASDAFRTISRGAYSGLASQPNKDSEDLIALGADGTSKLASQLSKGTRFQLYLALRFAGYCEFARLRPPVPFIADDILETFDDDRAEQALRLLAGIGEMGQAIYLTHHRHLCDIARQVCPDARLHQL